MSYINAKSGKNVLSEKKTKVLDWLLMGVQHGVITETKAQTLYQQRGYAKLPQMDFLKLLYGTSRDMG